VSTARHRFAEARYMSELIAGKALFDFRVREERLADEDLGLPDDSILA
jgi:hypothetical protein